MAKRMNFTAEAMPSPSSSCILSCFFFTSFWVEVLTTSSWLALPLKLRLVGIATGSGCGTDLGGAYRLLANELRLMGSASCSSAKQQSQYWWYIISYNVLGQGPCKLLRRWIHHTPPYTSGWEICTQKFRNVYQWKEIEEQITHFKSTFTTGLINRFSSSIV